ncbi:hypothetical protein GN958_ATG04118, partial [Phytophthora infestans]
ISPNTKAGLSICNLYKHAKEKTRTCVAVKMGEFGHTSRTRVLVPVEDAEFEFEEEQYSFDSVFANGRKGKHGSGKITRPNKKMNLKPSQHAKQAQLVPLTTETWPGMLAQTTTNRRHSTDHLYTFARP